MSNGSLTEEIEAFCVEYVRVGNGRLAYQLSHPNSKAKPATMRVEACRILQRPNVRLMIEQLRQAALEKSTTTVQSLMLELDQSRELAMETENSAAATTATMGKARIAGFLKPEDAVKVGGVNVSITISGADADLL